MGAGSSRGLQATLTHEVGRRDGPLRDDGPLHGPHVRSGIDGHESANNVGDWVAREAREEWVRREAEVLAAYEASPSRAVDRGERARVLSSRS